MLLLFVAVFFFFKQKTAYDMRISDWSSDVCSSDLSQHRIILALQREARDRVAAVRVGAEREDEEFRAPVRDRGQRDVERGCIALPKIGRASCRERVCQYV